MTGPARVRSQRTHEDWALQGLPLPGHVIVLTGAGWRRGWLVARENGPAGWMGLVQYESGAAEITEYLPAGHIASPDVWAASDPPATPASLTARLP